MADYTSTAATTLALTLAEAKAQMRVTHDREDDLIVDYIKAATRMLEDRTNRCFVTQTRTLKMDSFEDCRYVRGRRIYPARSPIKNSSGASITYLDASGVSTTLASSDYVVSTGDMPGFFAEAYNATFPSVYPQPNSVTITYVAGHSTVSSGVPPHIKQAIRMVAEHWYRNRGAVLTGTISKEIELGVDALLASEMVETYA